MTIRDVEVVIDRRTQSVSQTGFGTPLILASTKDHPFTTYSTIEALSADFDESTGIYKRANRIFSQNPRPEKIAVLGVAYDSETADPTAFTTTLNDNAQKDFYFLFCEVETQAVVQELSGWAEANKKLYFFNSDDPSIHGTLQSDYTVAALHTDAESYLAEGWVGVCAPQDPGSITWKFKTITGITEADYSASEIDEIVEDGGNTYIRQGGVLHTYDGRTTSGEWIDVIRSQHFIEERIKESVFQTLVSAPKVPYDSRGIAMIEVAIESVLKTAFSNGMIAADDDGQALYSVSTPSRNEISSTDRKNRVLPDVTFEFELSGAIHKTKIHGVIRV
ncbi:DUF3383 domain-containing protein [Bacillaceae bacterium SIJ1]|uniref:DUF3383 family protein n=1 Tax=Litoribacterium kuwaitense TaxID=1398745 RepID=UPI0013EC8FB6|nr:DUF3383 family protein [Litoribacterium kuwaitense]NGP45969.1 DUF3383 domain-containing protein [Litoribacterium kuwaitense]